MGKWLDVGVPLPGLSLPVETKGGIVFDFLRGILPRGYALAPKPCRHKAVISSAPLHRQDPEEDRNIQRMKRYRRRGGATARQPRGSA